MIIYLGNVTRKEVNELYGKSRVGLVLYQPAQNHFDAQPIKMFEYMAAGLPVIASDFPHWKEIVASANCGICVDPTSYEEVHEACMFFINNLSKAQELGRNGRKAVEQNYNWCKESQKLIELYSGLQEDKNE